MIDLDLVGLTPEFLEKKLSGDPLTRTNPEDPVVPLLNRIRSRIQEGRDRNFKDYKTYFVIDQAWDTPFRQVNPTLMQMFQDADTKDEEVIKKIESWGLTSLISQETDPKSGKPVGPKVFNLPIFFKIIIPLVRTYCTIRWAKIMNDRRLTPFFKYEPVKMTTPLRTKCEALTDRVQIMSNQYGYFDVMKQSVLKMLQYGFCFQLPREEWHHEEQWRKATTDDVQLQKLNAEGEPVKVGEKIKVTDREGIRYDQPHPTRTFYDISYGKHTMNYDAGCKFYGSWRVERYRDVLEAPGLWNKDKITLGNADIIGLNPVFFQTVYSACTLKIPFCVPNKPGEVATTASTASSNDRETELANNYYGTEHNDQGVLVTTYFEKLIPKDNGLGDYDCPIWMKFLVAGDSGTILYACPLPYSPGIYYGYDADESRSINPGMGLEILPFQDHISNLMSQINLSAQQNLTNMIMLDTDQIEPSWWDRIKNAGVKMFTMINIVPFSGKKAQRAQNKVSEVSHSVSFPKANTAELTNILKTILDLVERVLVMSSQEVAQAASHEQTREEIRNIAQTTSSRLQFTSTPVDIARDAWKRQLYQGLMAYGDDDIYVYIPSETRLTKQQLTAMGFTYVDKDTDVESYGSNERYRHATIKKADLALPLWSFASNRDGEDRNNDQQAAVAMAMLWDKVANNPMLAPAIGADQMIEWANRIGQLAGLDRDFKLRNMGPDVTPEQQQQEAKAQIDQAVEAVLQQADQHTMQALTPIMDQINGLKGEVASGKQAIAELTQVLQPLNA